MLENMKWNKQPTKRRYDEDWKVEQYTTIRGFVVLPTIFILK